MKTFSRVIAALLALGLGACDVALPGENGGALQGAAGKLEFVLVPQTPVGEGPNDFSMTLVDIQTMKPVSGAVITLHTTMPAMGHQTNAGEVEERTAGSYLLRGLVFDMPGDWAVRIQVHEGELNDEVVFPFNVP